MSRGPSHAHPVLRHLSTLPLHQPSSSSAVITGVLQHCSSPSALQQARGRRICVFDQSLLAGWRLACQIIEPWLAREGFQKFTEVRTNPDPNRGHSDLPIGAQKRPHLRPKSGPAGTFCETKMGSPGETKMSSPGETLNCFSIVKASPRGGRIVSPGELILVSFFCSPVRGPALLLVSPKGSSSRTRAAPCLPSPSPLNEASISGPTASFCPLPPNQDQMVGVLGWKGSSRQQTQVSCRCLPMFVRHTSSKEIARCTSVQSGIVGTSHDPTALAVFCLHSGSFLQSRKFSQTDRGKQRDI